MSYTDKAALIAAYGEQTLIELTDEAQAAIDDAVLDERIAHIDGIIDGFCQAKYTVPFAVTPTIIADIALKLVLAELYDRGNEMPDKVASDETYARKLLDQINRGLLKLSADTGATVNTSDMLSFKPRRFNKQTLSL